MFNLEENDVKLIIDPIHRLYKDKKNVTSKIMDSHIFLTIIKLTYPITNSVMTYHLL